MEKVKKVGKVEKVKIMEKMINRIKIKKINHKVKKKIIKNSEINKGKMDQSFNQKRVQMILIIKAKI